MSAGGGELPGAGAAPQSMHNAPCKAMRLGAGRWRARRVRLHAAGITLPLCATPQSSTPHTPATPPASPWSPAPPPSDVVGPLKGFRLDQIPLSEVVSRVGGQQQFKAAVVEHVMLKAMEAVRRGGWRDGGR